MKENRRGKTKARSSTSGKDLEFSLRISLISINRVPTKVIHVILGCHFRCLLSIIKKAVIPPFSALVKKLPGVNSAARYF